MTTVPVNFFIVAGRFNEHIIQWPRPDGNPFPYERKGDARKAADRLNRQKASWEPLTVTIEFAGVQSKIDIDTPSQIHFGVYDWITHKEIVW